MSTIRVLGVSGSLRKASTNTGMLRFVGANIDKVTLPEGVAKIEFQIADISKLPLFDGDIPDEEGNEHPDVAAFRKLVLGADLFIFAIPEYNFSFSACFKNAIDWASRGPKGNAWKDKVAGMVSAAGGTGGVKAQIAFRSCAVFLNMHLLNSPEVCIRRFVENAPFDEATGNLTDATSQGRVLDMVNRSVAFHVRLNGNKK